MGKLKELDRLQKGILLALLVMVLFFSVLYPITVSRVGILYQDAIFVPEEKENMTVYSGKIKGEQAQFTVQEDGTVLFQYGGKQYGPYTAKEDPTALPEGREAYMTGVELRQGDNVLFRGGIGKTDQISWLVQEDGTLYNLVEVVADNGVNTYVDGVLVDPYEPSVKTLLNLIFRPELTHKGEWALWLCGVVTCILTACSILYADELFRFQMAFHVKYAYEAEPSDLEIAGRYLSWIALAVLSLCVFIMGLK